METCVVVAVVPAHVDVIRLHVAVHIVHQALLIVKINRQAATKRVHLVLFLFDVLGSLLVQEIYIHAHPSKFGLDVLLLSFLKLLLFELDLLFL